MFRFLISVIIIISVASFALSQEIKPKAEKIDEFGAINECDLGARIDNLFITLQNNPESKGKIIIYKGLNVLPGQLESQNSWLSRFIHNYILLRGFDKSKIEIIETGFRDERVTELWIVPKNAETPKPINLKLKPKFPINKTYLYDSKYLSQENYETEPYIFLLPKIKAEYDNEDSDSYSKELKNDELKFYEENKFFWLNDNFGKVLKNNPKLYGEIIFYADDTLLDTAKIKKFIQEGKDKIINDTKILPDRIKITFGGYKGFVKADFWIVNLDDKQPIPTPEERPDLEEN